MMNKKWNKLAGFAGGAVIVASSFTSGAQAQAYIPSDYQTCPAAADTLREVYYMRGFLNGITDSGRDFGLRGGFDCNLPADSRYYRDYRAGVAGGRLCVNERKRQFINPTEAWRISGAIDACYDWLVRSSPASKRGYYYHP